MNPLVYVNVVNICLVTQCMVLDNCILVMNCLEVKKCARHKGGSNWGLERNNNFHRVSLPWALTTQQSLWRPCPGIWKPLSAGTAHNFLLLNAFSATEICPLWGEHYVKEFNITKTYSPNRTKLPFPLFPYYAKLAAPLELVCLHLQNWDYSSISGSKRKSSVVSKLAWNKYFACQCILS